MKKKKLKTPKPLRVLCCAVMVIKEPNVMFLGEDHISVMNKANAAGHRYFDIEQGFLLSDGAFARRERAMEVARAAGQVDAAYAAAAYRNGGGSDRLFTYMLRDGCFRARRQAAAEPARKPKTVKSEPLPPELAALRPEDPDDDFAGD